MINTDSYKIIIIIKTSQLAENFNSHFNTLYMEISPQSASFSAHNRFYGIIKTPGNLNEDPEFLSPATRLSMSPSHVT